jgi:hypothetical protein
MTRMKIGDIFEIATPQGRAYLHYVYKDNNGFDIVRVLPGLHEEAPEDIDMLAADKEKFVLSFPLTTAYYKNIVRRVGFHSVYHFEKPKFMQSKHVVRGEFLDWHLVDMDKWHSLLMQILTPAEKKLSPSCNWSDTLLVERLVV